MLVIRSEQLLALSKADDFGWLQRHVRARFPDFQEAVPADEIDAFLRRSLDEARALGLSQRADLGQFVNLKVLLGEDFVSRESWAADILADDTTPESRLARLVVAAEQRVFSGP